jgi:hypothetical protein
MPAAMKTVVSTRLYRMQRSLFLAAPIFQLKHRPAQGLHAPKQPVFVNSLRFLAIL